MNRRSFIRVSSTGGLFLLGGPLLLSCSDVDDVSLDPWMGPSPLLDDEDIRLRIVSYGLLSPSFKNTQPWWVDIKGPGIDIRPETHRIPATLDPSGRQTRMSLGAFIETMSVAASSFGFDLDIRYYPDHETPPSRSSDIRVAHCSLTRMEESTTDPYFASILRRRTDRSTYREKPLEARQVSALQTTQLPDPVSLILVSDHEHVDSVSAIARSAGLEELADPQRKREALDHVRFTSEDVRNTHDGITLRHSGLTATDLLWFGIVSAITGNVESRYADRMPDLILTQTGSAAAYGVLLTPNDTDLDQVLAGRALMRMHLHATQLGLALQPFSTVVESETARQDLAVVLGTEGKQIQGLFRLGFGTDVLPSPRRSLFEIVRI